MSKSKHIKLTSSDFSAITSLIESEKTNLFSKEFVDDFLGFAETTNQLNIVSLQFHHTPFERT